MARRRKSLWENVFRDRRAGLAGRDTDRACVIGTMQVGQRHNMIRVYGPGVLGDRIA
ncbi:hypothetical protein HMPREF0591_5509 [Mycobacterium parascrofulaceum ATCC BAA-614]|uniref:Uncharacterized protein n=1 Tax=Mycobacterium parascrofulaceum ATCC BAA-614 TaxID=525368 RepID=D5PH65_9MYCO|nr:hypothetical protein HMPREF0591_5509 [Mycobacterium parascrofulaceum ATCC BAA-614]